MRRIMVLGLAMAMTLVMAAPAAAGPNGELTSAFRNEVNQFTGDIIELDRPEGHVTPLGPDPVSVCDQQVIGTWYSVFDSTREAVEDISAEILLDGVELETVRTPVRKRTLAGDRIFHISEGVPVIGTLTAGPHALEYRFDLDGDDVIDFVATTTLEVSPANC